MNNQEQDKLKPHSYDGIEEYDNRLPNWWLGTFVITVLFGFGYWLYYQTYQAGPSLVDEWAQDTARLSAAQKASGPGPGKTMDSAAVAAIQADKEQMAKAQASYAQNCLACHGDKAQGIIGPNLTDDYWIHGGKPERIYHTIAEGVTEKGMLSWKGLLTPEQIEGLTAYILSLKGTNPPGAKPPQGDKEI